MAAFTRRRLLYAAAALPAGFALLGRTPATTAKGGSLFLYRSADGSGNTFRMIDPMSLADIQGGPILVFSGDYPGWTFSGDGQVLAVVEYTGVGAPLVKIRLGPGLAVGTTFALPFDLGSPMLNGDGSLLILQAQQSGSPSGVTAPRWEVYATAGGGHVATIAGEGEGVQPYGFHGVLLDGRNDALYVPFVPGDSLADGPLPLRIARYALRTGRETGRVELPDVLAGSWFPEDAADMGMLNDARTPGVALDPAGDRLAVVDPATGRVALVATATMTLERSFVPERRTGLPRRIAGWLSPFAQSAEAKLTEGTMLRAAFAADGGSIYVSGKSVTVGDSMEEVEARGMGIRRIDLGSGEIAAAVMDGADVTELWVAPGGEAVYALAYAQPWEARQGTVDTRLIPGEDGDSVIEVVAAAQAAIRLVRLDPATLDPQATRDALPTDWFVAVSSPAAYGA